MRATMTIVSTALLLLFAPTVSSAQTAQDYWSTMGGGSRGFVLHFLDVASITPGTRPNSVRYWQTSIYRTPWRLSTLGYVKTGATLTEVDCQTSEHRDLQGSAWDSDGNFLYTTPEPTEWRFAEPRTIIAGAISIACTGRNSPSAAWIHIGNMNAETEAARLFGELDAD